MYAFVACFDSKMYCGMCWVVSLIFKEVGLRIRAARCRAERRNNFILNIAGQAAAFTALLHLLVRQPVGRRRHQIVVLQPLLLHNLIKRLNA